MNNIEKLVTFIGESKPLKAELNAIGVDIAGLVNEIGELEKHKQVAKFTEMALEKGSMSPRFKYLDDDIKNVDQLVEWGIKKEARK